MLSLSMDWFEASSQPDGWVPRESMLRKRETKTEREIQRQSDQSMIRKMDICGEESAVRARGQDDITVVK